MIIKKEISGRILTISTSRKENKGGIATLVNDLSKYYEKFNYVASTRSKNPIVMLWYFAMCILWLFYFILIRRIRIVHIHGASYGSFVRKMIIINICRLMKVKTVYHMHGAEFKLFYAKYNRKDIIKKTIDKVDALVVLSKSWKDFFLSVTDEKRIYIVNNMIDNPDFVRCYQQNQSVVRFLFLGRIGERKGIFDLLEAIKEQKDYLNNKFLLHVGGDGEADRLIDFITKNNLENLVKFEGWVSGKKKKELLSICDVFILPSYNEGLPLAILEAMSYGMPVISTTVGGIPEAVSDKENGFLIEPGNKQQILESMSYFLEQPQEIEKMGYRSLTMIRNFYPEEIIPKLNSIYEKLLQ